MVKATDTTIFATLQHLYYVSLRSFHVIIYLSLQKPCEKTKAQRDCITCPMSHSRLIAESGFMHTLNDFIH